MLIKRADPLTDVVDITAARCSPPSKTRFAKQRRSGQAVTARKLWRMRSASEQVRRAPKMPSGAVPDLEILTLPFKNRHFWFW